MLPTSFETVRLIARPPVLEDAAQIFCAYGCRPEASRYLLWRPHRDIAETTAFLTECIAVAHSSARRPYVLVLRDAPDIPIGMLDGRPAGHIVDVGYVLAPAHWGQGYMPEALRAFTEQALRDEVYRVQAFCDTDNRPSQRALEKAGFQREGRLERYAIHQNISAEPRPCYMYSRCR